MLNIDEIEDKFSDNEEELQEILKGLGIDMKDLESHFDDYNPQKVLNYTADFDENLPKYNYGTDSGFDLHSTSEVIVSAQSRALIPTGLRFDIPDGTELQIRSKSGLAINQGLMVLNSPGTIDCGYTGEIQVIIFNTNTEPFTITKGMKVAQAVLCPVINGKWVQLKRIDKINEKDRGSNGFGSTGINK